MYVARSWVGQIRTPLAPGEVRLFCVRLDGNSHTIDAACRNLSLIELARAAEFKLAATRTSFIVSRGVLRALLAELCRCAPVDVPLEHCASGKPYLAGVTESGVPIHFNLSHSGDITVYGITGAGQIGVDVEIHRPMPDIESIAARFFSKAEHEELLHLSTREREAAFFDCWTRKEAYVKALGGGLCIPLDSFRVSLAPGEVVALLEIDGDQQRAQTWFLAAFSPAPGYSGAVAVRNRDSWLHVFPIGSVQEILSDAGIA